MSDEQKKAWTKRWQAVRDRELEELRNASVELRYRQAMSLLYLGQSLDWFEKMRTAEDQAAEADVRRRWIQLKKAARGEEEKSCQRTRRSRHYSGG